MPFHIAGWSASVDQAAIAAIAAIADPAITYSGNNIQIPDFGQYLMGAYASGVNLTRAQLQSPSLRRVLNPEIRPIDRNAAPASYPGFLNLFLDAVKLDVSEQMQAYAAEDAAGASRMNVFVWLGDGKVEAISDQIFTVRVTGATTLTAYAWTPGAMVFDQVLPVGDYAIVGARCESTGMIAFRFIFQGQTPRPGGLGLSNETKLDPQGQRFGGWGNWGIFNSTTPPNVEYFSGSADTSEVLALDLIRVG